MNNIMVERETYKKNDKEFYTYFIKGVIRGKAVKVAVVPPDNGGYAVLDIVFGNEMAAQLVVTPFEMTDEAGKKITGNTYAVHSEDADGTVYECKVKPFRQSDKNMLNMLLR